MDFRFSQEQDMLRDAARRMVAARSPADAVRAAAATPQGYDPAVWQAGCELGWPGLALPESCGGSDQTLLELAIVAEELGRAVQPGPFVPTTLVGLALAADSAGDPAADTGPGGWRGEVLETLAAGSATATWALAEPGSPWGAAGLAAKAERSGDEVVLTGVKTAVQDAATTRWLLVTALLDGAPVAFLLDGETPGVRRRDLATLDITRRFGEVVLDGARVPADRQIGTVGGRGGRGGTDDVNGTDGTDALDRLLAAGAILTAADALGAASQLLAMTVDYAKTRHQFGRPIGSFQAIKHKCADMLLRLTGTRVAVYNAAASWSHALPSAEADASTAKSFAAEATDQIAGEALQVHGGIGMTWEHDLHLFLRRIRTDGVLYGDAAHHHERLCTLLLRARGA